ncbi:MAG: nucleotide exchange factor GrpE [Candidatus Competibacterales bacterium]
MSHSQRDRKSNTSSSLFDDVGAADALGTNESPGAAAPTQDKGGETPATLRQQLEDATRELEAAKAKAEEHWNLFLGARAEADNVRKRAERDRASAQKYALEKFVNELLPVMDSLEMGHQAAIEAQDVQKLREGTELTLKMLASALEKFNVRPVDPAGERFNPDFHEAMTMQPTDQVAPNTVLQVIQKGYLLNDRLVRPALVTVAKAP